MIQGSGFRVRGLGYMLLEFGVDLAEPMKRRNLLVLDRTSTGVCGM
jgi:hypothetical protein